jgi:hypothetical protein
VVTAKVEAPALFLAQRLRFRQSFSKKIGVVFPSSIFYLMEKEIMERPYLFNS